MAAPSSTPVWRIPRTEEPQSHNQADMTEWLGTAHSHCLYAVLMLLYNCILAHSLDSPTLEVRKLALLVEVTVKVFSVHVQKTGLHKTLQDLFLVLY